MYIGEKLTTLSSIIYDFAKRRLDAANIDDTLAEFIMRDVHRRFLEGAYNASLIRQLSEVANDDANKDEQNETQNEEQEK